MASHRLIKHTSTVYNSSIVIYDPYSNSTKAVTIPGWSGNSAVQMSGIHYDDVSDSVIVSLTSTEVWDTSTNVGSLVAGSISGPELVVRYDVKAENFVYIANLAAAQAEFLAVTGNKTGGFQDSATDANGTTYTLSSYGNAVAAVSPTGNVSLWFGEPNKTLNSSHYGYGGLFIDNKVNKLVISDTISAGLVTFSLDTDMQSAAPVPTYVPIDGKPQDWTPISDGLYTPPKYNTSIALWSDDGYGIVVIASPDDWVSAKYLGRIDTRQGSAWLGTSVSTTTVQIVNSIYSVQETFQPVGNVTQRMDFVILDITETVERITQQLL